MKKILLTQNKQWGFWGTCAALTNKTKTRELWDTAFTLIQEIAGFTPQQTLALLDSRWGRHMADDFANEINYNTFSENFKSKITRHDLCRAFNYYVDQTAYQSDLSCRYDNFTKDLATISKRYGITLSVVGGVNINSSEDMDSFIGYTSDLESGDMLPIWQ